MSFPTMPELAKRGRHHRSAFPQIATSWLQAEKKLLARGLRQDAVGVQVQPGVYLVKVVDRDTGEPRGSRLLTMKDHQWLVSKVNP